MTKPRPLAIVIQASPERIGGCRRLPETSSEWHIASLNECVRIAFVPRQYLCDPVARGCICFPAKFIGTADSPARAPVKPKN
ncbi:hypothetical protein B5X24_HaOG215898 [Helicoverpa armigera]|nr:hypothetical protein B5X24_HaOG215898 [Helicoverpa armigera]